MNKDNVYKFIIFSVIAFLAIYLISFCFCYNPHSWYDEGIYLHISRILEEYHIFGIQLGQNQFAPLNLITVGYPVFLPVATVFHFFGVGIAQARGVAIAFMILFLGIVYLYSSKYLGKFSAIASILLLLSFSPFYGNGRNVLGEIPGMFFLMMGVYFFEIFLEKKSKFKLIFAALFFSITMSTKPTFLIIGPILFFLLVIYLAKKKIKLNHFVIFFVSLIPPLVFWVITQFGGFTNIFKIFNHYANPYGLSDVIPVILNNIVRFFTESTPIHFLFLFLVVFIGIIVEFGKKKNLRFSTAFLFLFIGLMLLSY